ncbi:cytochrome P450 monooxygenase [Aspergillus carlsbadensis]|nr:cytochrome P450 monooxygenase [Aspergillus carlsbadensis]
MGFSVPKHILPGAAVLQAVVAVTILQEASFRWYFLCALLGNVTCYAVYSIAIYPRWVSPFRHLPKPRRNNPLLGHTLAEFSMPRGNEYLHFTNETHNTGILHLQGLLGSDQLLLTSTAALHEALVQRAYDFEWPEGDRDFLRRILGSGLITARGEAHRAQRRHMAQGLGRGFVRGLYPVFWEYSRALVRGIVRELQAAKKPAASTPISGETDISNWAQRVSLDIIGQAGLGWDINTLTNPENELASNFERIFAPTLANVVLFGVSVYGPAWALDYLPAGISGGFLGATGKVREVCRAFIRSKRKSSAVGDEASASPSASQENILSQIMKQEGVSEDSLVDQTLTFLTAGHETVAIALTWAVYLLAKHPETQRQLRAELQRALPLPSSPADLSNSSSSTNSNAPETWGTLPSALESLPLLNGVINETFRLYPSAPVAVRVSVRDTSILGTRVPKGTRVIIAPWSVNRSVDIWGPGAESFVPERWIEGHSHSHSGSAAGTGTGTGPGTGEVDVTGGTTGTTTTGPATKSPLLTFLHGPRNCIGQGFARAELLALVAVFVRAFEVSLVSPDDVKVPGGSLSAKPAGGMRVRVTVVDGAVLG